MKANTEPAESRETQIALYNEEPGNNYTRGSRFPLESLRLPSHSLPDLAIGQEAQDDRCDGPKIRAATRAFERKIRGKGGVGTDHG